MRKGILVSLLFVACAAIASGDNPFAGARAAAVGNASVTFSDVFATTNNQAGLGFIENYQAGVYADRKFLFAAIHNFNGAVVLPVRKVGSFGLSANFFGYRLYNETKVGLAYARKFGAKFSLGVQFDYLRLSMAEWGNRNFFTLEAGIIYRPWKVLSIGAHIYNPVPYKINAQSGERLPTIVKFGMSYTPAPKVVLAAEYEQDIYYKPRFKSGIEYLPVRYLALRTGVQTTPFQFSFGLGAQVAGFHLDAASLFHPVLGFTPQLALIYIISTRKKS